MASAKAGYLDSRNGTPGGLAKVRGPIGRQTSRALSLRIKCQFLRSLLPHVRAKSTD